MFWTLKTIRDYRAYLKFVYRGTNNVWLIEEVMVQLPSNATVLACLVTEEFVVRVWAKWQIKI